MSVERFSEVFGEKKELHEYSFSELADYCMEQAAASPRKRALLLLHEGDFETFHRMINGMRPDTEVAPHMHPSELQTEIYIPLKGEAVVVIFTDEGEIKDYSLIGEKSKNKFIEIKPKTWHTIIPLTPFAMLEFKGQVENYKAENDKVFAAWAPLEGDEELGNYILELKAKIQEKI